MLLAEPAVTPFDWHFRLFGFPVRVSPWFWLGALLLSGGGSGAGGVNLVICILAIFLSILIHELGHAFAYRYFGMRPQIVLYQFGGLAIADRMSNWNSSRSMHDPRSSILISAAGPALQIAVGVFVFALFGALSYQVIPPLAFLEKWLPPSGGKALSPSFSIFLNVFCHISVFWALLNLLPVFPLDGGQISRNVFMMYAGYQGIRNSIILSIAAAGIIALWGFQQGDQYLGLMFMMLAVSSYQLLNQSRGLF